MKRTLLLVLVALLAVSLGMSCGPDVRIVDSGLEVYDLVSPGDPIAAGEPVGIRIPLRNVGSAVALAVDVTVELIDKNGVLLQERSFGIAKIPAGAQPIFNFQPFDTDDPDLIDVCGTGHFRISYTVDGGTPRVRDHSFPIVPGTPDTRIFEHFAKDFDPFAVYAPGDPGCFGVWSDTVSLLAALELYDIDPQDPLAISPAAAEAHVRHLAEQHLALNYDPQNPGVPYTCEISHPEFSNVPAALAYLLKRRGAGWGQDTRDLLRRLIHLPAWYYLNNKNLYNKSVQMPTMRLLFGEAACHAPSWDHGWNQLSDMFYEHSVKGGFESHDLHYSIYHFGVFGLLHALDTTVPRDMARTLFDLKAMLAAHMYLPGGQLGMLYTRADPFFFPGTERERAMGPVVRSLGAGDDFVCADAQLGPHATSLLSEIAVRHAPLDPAIQQMFHEKASGYETWWLQRPGRSRARYPGTLAFLGEDSTFAYAWHFALLPGGVASMGTSYGAWELGTGNKEGVAVRCPSCEQGFAFTYQWQACTSTDTDDAGASFCDPNDPVEADASGYDAERIQVHRTRISLFDPRSRLSRWPATSTLPVPRGDERTLAYLTNWSHPVVGGEKISPTAGGWYVGRLGDVFIAYRPLGDSIAVSQLDGARVDGGTNVGYATLFEMDGRSGGITVLATADEFAGDTLADFAAEMDARYWSFTAAGPNDGPVAETDYRAANGQLCRMKLEYMGTGGLPGSERRYIDCSPTLGTGYVEQLHDDFFAPLLGGQLMSSPFVSYDIQTDVLTVDVPTFPTLQYDWGALRYPPLETPVGCSGRAYLELGEPPSASLASSALAPVPAVDVDLTNAGFADTTVSVSFAGDDCTAGGAPNGDWLEPPLAPEAVTVSASTTIHVAGSASGCEAGVYAGELIFTTLEANAFDARLPVTLDVSP